MASPEVPAPGVDPSRRSRIRQWFEMLYRHPSEEEEGAAAHRRRLLEELHRAVAEAPDDTPIKDVVDRLNHHPGD